MGPPHRAFAPIRRLGQNFLVDRNAARRLVALADLNRDDRVLEVGAGYGNLTSLLAERAGSVIAVERDGRLVASLRKKFAAHLRVQVLHDDFLKMDLPPFDKVVSTPPYYISSKLVLKLLGSKFKAAVLAFQREFAERLAAEPGSRDYGRLTVMVAHSAKVELLDIIPRSFFRPVPKVDSRIVRITPAPRRTEDHKVFEDLVRELFNQRRRRTAGPLRRYLRKLFGGEVEYAVKAMEPPQKRVYELTPGEFERMADKLDRLMRGRG